MAGPSVDVAIPTYGRAHRVVGLIMALARQTRVPDKVWVIDDTPGADVRDAVAAVDVSFPIEYRRPGGRPSLTRARNLALDASDAEAMLFLDSDVTIAHDHVARMIDVLAGPQAPAAVQGYVPHDWPHRRLSRQVLFRLFLQGLNTGERMRFRLPMRNTFPDRPAQEPVLSDWLSGSNMMLHRGRLGDIRFEGRFERYGLGEDVEFSLKLGFGGRKMMLVPDAVVEEHNDDEGRVAEDDLALMRIINNRYILQKHFPHRRWRAALTWADIGWILQKTSCRHWPASLARYIRQRKAVRAATGRTVDLEACNPLYSFWEEE